MTPASADPTTEDRERRLAEGALRAVDVVQAHQLPRGGFACFRSDGSAEPVICTSTVVTAQICCWLEEEAALRFGPPATRPDLALGLSEMAWLEATLDRVLRRARAFLAWQEEADGSWRRLGRLSAHRADSLTSTLCTLALLPTAARSRCALRFQRRFETLSRLARDESERSRNLEDDAPARWVSDLARILRLRLCWMAGEDPGEESVDFEGQWAELADPEASVDDRRLRLVQASIRAANEGVLAGGVTNGQLENVRTVLLSAAREPERQLGALSGVLTTLALQDLGAAEVERLIDFLITSLQREVGRKSEAYLDDRIGSPALEASGVLVALARRRTSDTEHCSASR